MKYYAVVDTNVIVSALLKEQSIPWEILENIKNDRIYPLFNDEIIIEYEEVLKRNKFNFDESVVKNTINLILEKGYELNPHFIDEFFEDESDKVFYQITLTGISVFGNSHLITGNKKHFPLKEFVVTPAEMLEIINNDN